LTIKPVLDKDLFGEFFDETYNPADQSVFLVKRLILIVYKELQDFLVVEVKEKSVGITCACNVLRRPSKNLADALWIANSTQKYHDMFSRISFLFSFLKRGKNFIYFIYGRIRIADLIQKI
jgi:hypothetical protein